VSNCERQNLTSTSVQGSDLWQG